ncbi:MAG: IS1182 family transposase [Phycisphaerae bacterium]
MAYRYGDRKQRILFPQSVDEYIPKEAPVRAYDLFVDLLDLDELGIELDPHKVGCPQYDPKVMLKLLVYGYSYGVRSSRKLQREAHYNLSFIWLTSGLKPDHKTIAEFRRNNKSALKKVLRQCARLCVKLDLIEGNTLFVDGTKIRANASTRNTWTKNRCDRYLAKIDKRINDILSECDAADETEAGRPSLVRMKEELKNSELLKSKVENILKELKNEQNKSINTTDPECTRFSSKQGYRACYNVQSVVDQKHGLIVSSDVVNENNDLRQFAKQIEQANETLQSHCQTACADSGYSDFDELERIDEQDIKVVVPSQTQASGKEPKPFDKGNFKYDLDSDSYICPAGHILRCRSTDVDRRRKVYQIKGSVCKQCRHFGVCTKSRIGRKVTRLLKEELKEKLHSQYEQPDSQDIYALRKQKVELPFGHIKYNLKADTFLLRGLEGVKAETSILASCFNIARMVSIMGVLGLIAKLGS